MVGLVLHALNVGDGSLAISALPGRDGNYAGDLDFIRDWKPSLVITAMTRGEWVEAGAETLGSDIQGTGARWVHLPIADHAAPDAKARALWPDISATVLKVLRGQGRVMIQGNDGCGRAGMVALRVMVEAGEDPVAAVSRLRKVLPCAVETDGQLRWAATGQILDSSEKE